MTRNASHAAPQDAEDTAGYRSMLSPETLARLEEYDRKVLRGSYVGELGKLRVREEECNK